MLSVILCVVWSRFEQWTHIVRSICTQALLALIVHGSALTMLASALALHSFKSARPWPWKLWPWPLSRMFWPNTLQSCFTRVADMTSRWRLRSSASHRLEVPPVRLSPVGKRAFPVAGANMWNDLLFHITSAQWLAVFRQHLKTFLFCRSYPDILIWLTYHYWLLLLFFLFLAFPIDLAIIDII